MSNFSTPNTSTTNSSTDIVNDGKKNKNTTKKTVHFDNTISVNEISSYRDYTPNERLTSWYIDADYLIFNYLLIGNHNRCSLRRRYDDDKEQRSQCIKDIQYAVLQEQHIERMHIVTKDPRAKKFDLFQQWLAEFYHIHSKPYTLAAQQRAMENNNKDNYYNRIIMRPSSSSSPASSPLLLLPSVLLNPPYHFAYPTTKNNNDIDNNNNNVNVNVNVNSTTSTVTITNPSSVEGGCDLSSLSLLETVATTTIDNNDSTINNRISESLVDSDSNIRCCCKRLSSAIAESSSSNGEKSITMPSSSTRNNNNTSNRRVRQRRNSFCII